MASVTSYSISSYGLMIDDRVRLDGYTRALQQSIRPGSVVLDIGTGTGIFALLACQFGAARIYAIDPGDAIELARRTAARNGFADRIIFIQEISTRITLPEQVDVVVSNVGGVLPLFERHIPTIADTRRRFLKPGGILIPREDRLVAALVEAPDVYSRTVSPWESKPSGVDLSPTRPIAVNSWIKHRVKPEQLLVEPSLCGVIDYRTAEATRFAAEVRWDVQRDGTAHALSVWFDSTLADGVSFSNAPGCPETIFGEAFFPLTSPVPLAAGDQVTLSLSAALVEDDYVWNWDTVFTARTPDGPKTIAAFQQSSFLADYVSPTQLLKRADNFRPNRNLDAEVHFMVLRLMDGKTSLQEIAGQLLSSFPDRFQTPHEALTHAGHISERFSQ